MSQMWINETWMSRKAVLTVFGSIITVFVFFNYVAEPIRDYENVKIQVAENESDISDVVEVIDSIDRLVTLVAAHEASLNNIWPVVTDLKLNDSTQNMRLNELVSFANSGDRFTAADGDLLTAQLHALRETHKSDHIHVIEKIEELKEMIKDIQSKLE